METFPLDSYLKHLGLPGAPLINEAGLASLHRAQCFSIPFENIEPLLGRPVSLNGDKLAEKFLSRRRGGYCFELNGFFLAALQALGFQARPVLGRVFMGRPQAGPRTHQASLVELRGRTWLADVGFGGPGLFEPIPFEAGFEGEQQGRRIRLRADSVHGLAYEDFFEGAWRLIYAIPNERVEPVDLVLGNHYCATHPDSIFCNNLYASLPSAEGRVTVWNRSLHIQIDGEREERTLSTEADLGWLFRELLKIKLPAEDIANIHRKLPL